MILYIFIHILYYGTVSVQLSKQMFTSPTLYERVCCTNSSYIHIPTTPDNSYNVYIVILLEKTSRTFCGNVVLGIRAGDE